MSVEDRRARFLRAIAAYARAEPTRARLEFVALWNQEEEPGRRALLQGLLLVAASLERSAREPGSASAARLALEARRCLEGLPDVVSSVDVAMLRRDLDERIASLRAAADGAEGAATRESLPRVALVADVATWEASAPLPRPDPDAFAAGLAAYAAGEYFEAHERWEETWRTAGEPDDRQLFQGLVQIAAAMFKSQQRGEPAPAARLLERAGLRLTPLPRDLQGLDLGRVLRESSRARAVLAAAASAGDDAPLPSDLVPTIARLDG